MLTLEERLALLEEEVKYLKYKLDHLVISKNMDEDLYIEKNGAFVDKTKAARLLGVSRATVYNLLRDGCIISGYEGKAISVRSIYRYMNSAARKEKENA